MCDINWLLDKFSQRNQQTEEREDTFISIESVCDGGPRVHMVYDVPLAGYVYVSVLLRLTITGREWENERMCERLFVDNVVFGVLFCCGQKYDFGYIRSQPNGLSFLYICGTVFFVYVESHKSDATKVSPQIRRQ